MRSLARSRAASRRTGAGASPAHACADGEGRAVLIGVVDGRAHRPRRRPPRASRRPARPGPRRAAHAARVHPLLAERLDASAAVRVGEAIDGEPLEPGRRYIAPGGRHLPFARTAATSGRVRLDDGPPENSCRPSVDVLFRRRRRPFGGRVLAVVLTGMGHDGLRGAGAAGRRRRTVLAQDEATSVVWGMPGFVAAGLADAVLPLDEIAAAWSNAPAVGRPKPVRPGGCA